MFYKLVSRNSRRNRKENGLFFSSLLVSVIAFYIILSLSHQDVMVFLAQMESDAVDKLLAMIPLFYGATLVILFFLVYYASKFQLERRSHEFGVYLMLGMRRTRLFVMLLAEDLRNSAVSLLMGLPVAVLLSELISLVTARLVGLGIVGHQISFSPEAVLWTVAGFLLIKLAAFLIFSGRISRQEIGSLLVDTPEGTRRQAPALVHGAAVLIGILCLGAAYSMAINGRAWAGVRNMAKTLFLGLMGTFAFFWGLEFLMELIVKQGKKDRCLHIFNCRQVQETVIRRSGTLAVCALLMLAALCCFGAGMGISRYYGETGQHVLDYTFDADGEEEAERVRRILAEYGLDTRFRELFEMRVGHIRRAQDYDQAFLMEPVISALEEMPPSWARDVLLNNFSYAKYPYLISLSGYNRLLTAAGLPELELAGDEAAVYMDAEYASLEMKTLLESILETRPETLLAGETLYLTGKVQTVNLVTDRSITLSFALILPDEAFAYNGLGEHSVYLDGILDMDAAENKSYMSVVLEINRRLDEAGLSYESHLQNMGRQLFYLVASSYITLYLALIFLIIANTIIGVQFLIGQQKSKRRYRTLIHLGAGYDVLCKSARQQINLHFGIPVVFAVCGSLFGVRGLFVGILPSRARGGLPEMLVISAAMILTLCVIEFVYMAVVKRSSDRYLLTLTVPEREE